MNKDGCAPGYYQQKLTDEDWERYGDEIRELQEVLIEVDFSMLQNCKETLH